MLVLIFCLIYTVTNIIDKVNACTAHLCEPKAIQTAVKTQF